MTVKLDPGSGTSFDLRSNQEGDTAFYPRQSDCIWLHQLNKFLSSLLEVRLGLGRCMEK